MPRTNRIARATAHPNPLIGCIMLVQEKIRFLGHALLHCRCVEFEAELLQLQEELSTLQAEAQARQVELCRVQVQSQASLANYQQRINTLLAANARHVSLQARQTLAFRAEISALRNMIIFLDRQIIFCGVSLPEYPESTECPWEFVHNSHWELSSDWSHHYPG